MMKNDFTVIIPARMQSARLTGKMLLDIHGVPLIIRTVKQALLSNASNVIVATDDEAIETVCKKHDINVILTDINHQNGTDRVVEAAVQLGLEDNEIVVNVQGDEPLINPQLINNLATFIFNKGTPVATIAHIIDTENEIFNPSIVKVVLDAYNNALYFSRAPIPYSRDGFIEELNFNLPNGINFLRHIGMYAYSVDFLKNYKQMLAPALEHVEKLEQLRILYNGYKMAVMVSDIIPEGGVDTLEDLTRVRQYVANLEISGKGGSHD